MYLLYADESGSPGGSEQKHFVLAGFTVFERQAHWLSLELDKIAAQFNPHEPETVELHASPMFAGRKFWRNIPKDDRLKGIKDALSLIDGKRYRIIASVVRKSAISPQDPVRSTFQPKYRTKKRENGGKQDGEQERDSAVGAEADPTPCEKHSWICVHVFSEG